MRNPFFSIVIPMFNREEFIRETLESVINQTFKDFEIIVVDDGSTDKSAEVIKSIDFPELKYFYINNSERGAARNYGIQSAKGEFIVLLDSDDIMLEDHLSTLNEYCEKPYDFIATKYFCKTETGKKEFYSEIVSLKEGHHNYKTFLEGNMLACNFAFRRENQSLKLFRESRELSIMEDWIFLLENLADQEIYIIDKYTIAQKHHAKRSMQENNSLVVQRKLNALQWINDNFAFPYPERKILKSHAFYFIAIHYYIDNKRFRALKFLYLSVVNGKVDLAVFSLFLKSILGRRIIEAVVRIWDR